MASTEVDIILRRPAGARDRREQEREESGAYGIRLRPLREHFDRFEEACMLLGLLSQSTTFAGRYYQLTDARNERRTQQPHRRS